MNNDRRIVRPRGERVLSDRPKPALDASFLAHLQMLADQYNVEISVTQFSSTASYWLQLEKSGQHD